MAKFDVCQIITDKIIDMMETAGDDWRMPWHSRGGVADLSMPHNAMTGKNYQGANILLLWGEQTAKGYATPVWATENQWFKLGAKVMPEYKRKGTLCIKWNPVEKKDEVTGKVKKFLLPFGFNLFNAAQVDGWNGEQPKRKVYEDLTEKIAAAEIVLESSGINVTFGTPRAMYSPALDVVNMPSRESFINTETSTATENFYSTLFHELSHATGHDSRLKRNLSNRFGSEAYAMEELVAELSAAFCCGTLEISNEPRKDHARYLNNWLNVLKADKKAIVNAAQLAQKATSFLMEKATAETE